MACRIKGRRSKEPPFESERNMLWGEDVTFDNGAGVYGIGTPPIAVR
eukprot:CAMPEP_0176437464 /NCGR_PEP_ID=MMETSP0127-20121128/18643_1 /TAXON_ID=938130 /ORGANISM="Platyophrya macrostoma, Strain WH" /LENGTH=46 /DNA_ID= /DNA_START= /DNA_END= /DNA_ORIENTATION=